MDRRRSAKALTRMTDYGCQIDAFEGLGWPVPHSAQDTLVAFTAPISAGIGQTVEIVLPEGGLPVKADEVYSIRLESTADVSVAIAPDDGSIASACFLDATVVRMD